MHRHAASPSRRVSFSPNRERRPTSRHSGGHRVRRRTALSPQRLGGLRAGSAHSSSPRSPSPERSLRHSPRGRPPVSPRDRLPSREAVRRARRQAEEGGGGKQATSPLRAFAGDEQLVLEWFFRRYQPERTPREIQAMREGASSFRQLCAKLGRRYGQDPLGLWHEQRHGQQPQQQRATTSTGHGGGGGGSAGGGSPRARAQVEPPPASVHGSLPAGPSTLRLAMAGSAAASGGGAADSRGARPCRPPAWHWRWSCGSRKPRRR
eukprot:COSAG01_NODE_958_length_12470_cov_52.097729_9_plen_264_part_00